MKTRFAHLADVHLGYQQYGLEERFDDFGRAWLDAIDRCIRAKVDFVVIAGDLFEKRSVEPCALLHAQEGLRRLRRAGIPVVAVEGNHDRALYRDGMSWMEFLDTSGDLILLNPCVPGQTGLCFRPHQRETGGSYVDIGGVRIVGQPYLGASAGRVLEETAAHLRLEGRGDTAYLLFVCHAGLEGVLPHASACLTPETWDGLRPWADYIALGHIHKRFEHENSLFNPGSLEARGSDEAGCERGFYIVDVDTDTPEKHHAVLHTNRRRPWILLSLPMEAMDGPAALADALRRRVQEHKAQTPPTDDAPLVELKLTGRLLFDASCLDTEALAQILREAFAPLHVSVRCLAREDEGGADAEAENDLSRDLIERRVLTDHFAAQPDYRAQAEAWARVTTDIKRMALEGTFAPADMLSALRERAAELMPQEAI
jgi:DNA repair exonuclease SbcCD nuclease subunit